MFTLADSAQMPFVQGYDLVAMSNGPVSRVNEGTAADQTFQALGSYSFPANVFRRRSRIIAMCAWEYTNSANVKNMRAMFGGNNLGQQGPTTTVTMPMNFRTWAISGPGAAMQWQALNTTNGIGDGASTNAKLSPVINSTTPTLFDFQAAWASGAIPAGTETITLLAWEIYLIPGG